MISQWLFKIIGPSKGAHIECIGQLVQTFNEGVNIEVIELPRLTNPTIFVAVEHFRKEGLHRAILT
jgi:hypothetical protein